MTEYGDLILKIFHKNNFTYSSGMTWENLLKVVLAENDEESRELLIKVNYCFLKQLCEISHVVIVSSRRFY